eukprot:6437322-Amphidinium_carterae.1
MLSNRMNFTFSRSAQCSSIKDAQPELQAMARQLENDIAPLSVTLGASFYRVPADLIDIAVYDSCMSLASSFYASGLLDNQGFTRLS